MAICGHQFRAGDETDWISCTSAELFGSSSTIARHIMQELFKKYCENMTIDAKIKKRHDAMRLENPLRSPSKYTLPLDHPLTEEQGLTIKKISSPHTYDNFDDSQHLNGCPVKWLYNKKILEMNKMYRVERCCSKKSAKKEETVKEKNRNVRDKTPCEVKIHKINLMEKYTNSYEENCLPACKSDRNSDLLEAHRKKLAAKLNWKLYDESQENCSPESSSEISSRQNYLPPRPLLGLKPLLSIMLAPNQEATKVLKVNSLKEDKPEASLSIQSLNFPLPPAETKLRPRTTNIPRCNKRLLKHPKKLQVPNQITIKLRQNQNISNQKVFSNPPTKKANDKPKQKSLSTLFYELKDKTRNENEEFFEEMIRNLTMEDHQFKIKRFLNFDPRLHSAIPNTRKKKDQIRPLTCRNMRCGRTQLSEKVSECKTENVKL